MTTTNKENILFIVNPISGGRSKTGFEKMVHENLNLSLYNPTIQYSSKPGHASELAKEGLSNSIQKIIAVGGDGTVNEVAKMIVHSPTALGIIPFGSGNGLARHMGIPMNPIKAIQKLNNPIIKTNDAGQINDAYFFCTCGMGFDAHIGKIFATLKGRGFSGYAKAVLKEFSQYKAQDYTLTINGKIVNKNAFLITFANASQYGNNAYIAPQANVADGKIDICILKPFPVYAMPKITFQVFSKSIQNSTYMDTYSSNSDILIERTQEGPIHIDGEPYEMGKSITIKVHPNSLKIIA